MSARVRVQTRNERNIDEHGVRHGWPVVMVWYGEPADIENHKFTKDYSRYSERPWVIARTGVRYKTLEAALRAYGLLTPLETTA